MVYARDIADIKATRRQHLAELLNQHGKVALSNLVDINADYLWQMGKGKGKSQRGISDKTARKIESGVGKPTGWMDHPHADEQTVHTSQPVRHDPDLLSDLLEAITEVLAEEYNRSFSIDDDPGWFLDMYFEAMAHGLKPRSVAAKVGAWTALRAPRGHGASEKTGTEGDHSRKPQRGRG